MSHILLVSATRLEHHDDSLFGIPIHIIGIGKVEAAINTLKLIQKFQPDHIVNFGSCGNLKDHKVGDVLEVGELHDDFYGCVVPEHDPIKINNSDIKLFTTDTFYDTDNYYSLHYNNMVKKCNLVDMEGYSIAKVAKNEGVKVSIYKWVSDDGSKSAWEENAASGYSNFKKIFKSKYIDE